MVLGRRELSAILLAIAAILVYLVLLSTRPSGAQIGGGTTGVTASQITTQPITTQQITPNATQPSNQGGVVAIANSSRKPQRERTVVNVPNKPLPPSGGLPVYGVVISSILAGVGLFVLGFAIRRDPRR